MAYRLLTVVLFGLLSYTLSGAQPADRLQAFPRQQPSLQPEPLQRVMQGVVAVQSRSDARSQHQPEPLGQRRDGVGRGDWPRPGGDRRLPAD